MHWIAPSEKDIATAARFFSFSALDGEKVAQPDEVSPESGKWARVRYSPSSTSSNQFGALSCKVRSASCERPSVRQSHFVIRHCPAPHDATGRFDFVLANPPFNNSGWFREDDDMRWQMSGTKSNVQSSWH